MKKYLLLVIFSIMSLVMSLAQVSAWPQDISKYKVVDESSIQITYSLDFKNTPSSENYYNDIRTVQIGKRIVKDFSAIMLNNDSINVEREKKGLDGQILQKTIYPYEIFNNYENNKCLITYRTIGAGPVLRYLEEQPSINWELQPVSEIILGYNCQIATTHFAGRDYKAWFTIEVPINAGPYKFNGLPGLILKVEEINLFFIWTATEIKSLKKPILEYEVYGGYENCTKKKANDTIKAMFASPIAFVISYSNGKVGNIQYKDGRSVKATGNEISFPYEHLEK